MMFGKYVTPSNRDKAVMLRYLSLSNHQFSSYLPSGGVLCDLGYQIRVTYAFYFIFFIRFADEMAPVGHTCTQRWHPTHF